MKKKRHLMIVLVTILVVLLAQSQYGQNRRQRPPEYNEMVKAMAIKDLNARIKELERIKAAYPESNYQAQFDGQILSAKIGLCSNVADVLNLQKTRFKDAQGFNKLYLNISCSRELIDHPNHKSFDKSAVTEAISNYENKVKKLAADPGFKEGLQERMRGLIDQYAPSIVLFRAQALLNEGKAGAAKLALKDFHEMKGKADKQYYYIAGTVAEKLNQSQAAFDNFLKAAGESYQDSVEKAKSHYQKINGNLEGFDKKLETIWRALPFHPEHFSPGADWQGKVVLAELFTGSECPPCVAADLGFDGLIHAYGSKYLAVLEYHLPIPRPDPIMNHATKLRQDYYGVRSTPSTYFDGESKLGGGGGRANSENKYKAYAKEINSRMSVTPEVKMKVSASLNGDEVTINFKADKIVEGADYNLALVQYEEKYGGSNGIVFHKLVVREFKSATPGKKGTLIINLTESENAAEKHLLEYEKERSFTFEKKHFKISRDNLQVVFFVQDKASKKVLNATVGAVK